MSMWRLSLAGQAGIQRWVLQLSQHNIPNVAQGKGCRNMSAHLQQRLKAVEGTRARGASRTTGVYSPCTVHAFCRLGSSAFFTHLLGAACTAQTAASTGGHAAWSCRLTSSSTCSRRCFPQLA